MLSHRYARLLIVSLLALLATLPVAAARPTNIPVDDTFEDPFLTQLCGFPVEVRVQGTLIVRESEEGFDVTGARYRVTYTNLETGTSVVLRVSGLEQSTFDENGFSFSFSGRGALIVVPGEGAVFRDVGRVVFSVTFDPETGEPTVVSIVRGRHDEFSPELLCSLLSE